MRNDSLQLIDLNCQEIDDARAITKQKVYDLAKFIHSAGSKKEYILIIVCADEHMVDSRYGANNAILETVSNELSMDHYYLPSTNTILIRVNWSTLDNPVLRE